jgi:hypothetical protein
MKWLWIALGIVVVAVAALVLPVVWMICHMPHGGCQLW